MELNLTKPLAFFDLETTGISVAEDRIVEISVVKVYPDGKTDVYTNRPAFGYSTSGFFSEDVDGLPPGKSHIHNVGLPID
jgi:DNA polymerase-3 subunit epsilon